MRLWSESRPRKVPFPCRRSSPSSPAFCCCGWWASRCGGISVSTPSTGPRAWSLCGYRRHDRARRSRASPSVFWRGRWPCSRPASLRCGKGTWCPIQVSRTGDEIEYLGESFNRMIEALAASQEEIRLHQELLEERIRQRTEELERAMHARSQRQPGQERVSGEHVA